MSISCDASIVIATHNKAASLIDVLDSIFAQNVDSLQVVVVDDGSTDETETVCRAYPIVYSRIERPPGYRNPAIARNQAIRLAVGRVLIMQSDDVVHSPGAIERLRQVAADEMLFATVWNRSADGKIIEEYTGPSARRPLFFLGSVLAEHVLAIGGNDEEFVHPGYEDNWLADCLMNGCALRPRFLLPHEAHGFHLDHPRPSAHDSGYFDSRSLYLSKVKEARRTGVWRAKRGIACASPS